MRLARGLVQLPHAGDKKDEDYSTLLSSLRAPSIIENGRKREGESRQKIKK